MSLFTVTGRSGERARTGTLQLFHGPVHTPVFMPVGTAATVKAMTHEQITNLGFDLILGNTYHLYLRPGLDVIQAVGGLHRFSSWERNILTDSGGYQVFSLAPLRRISDEGVTFRSHLDGSEHRFTPESVVDAQVILGSDIQMVLDVCTGPGTSRSDAENALRITSDWGRRAHRQWQRARDEGYRGELFAIVQGNFYPDLRTRSVGETVALDTSGIAIGGLSVGEEPSVFREILALTSAQLPDDRPRYLMGVGTPDYIFDAVSAGIDMFDCVFPTRIARNGTVLTRDGRIVLRHEMHREDTRPIDSECTCRTCRRYSRAYLRHLFKSGEILGPMLATEHNLQFLADLLDGIRSSIAAGVYDRYRSDVLRRYEQGEQERQERR
jgi:queuine tRNA-ribosyltransferase